MSWYDDGHAPGSQPEPMGHSRAMQEEIATSTGTSTAKAAAIFIAAALLTFVAGIALERSGSAMADQTGLSGILFGATVLALATSLPEISTGLAAVKMGDFKLAVSDIFGGNAFLPVLFLLATVISGTLSCPQRRLPTSTSPHSPSCSPSFTCWGSRFAPAGKSSAWESTRCSSLFSTRSARPLRGRHGRTLRNQQHLAASGTLERRH